MGEKNTLILYDDAGEGSVMVKIPKFKISDVIEGGIEVVHPAFVVNGEGQDVEGMLSSMQEMLEGLGLADALAYETIPAEQIQRLLAAE